MDNLYDSIKAVCKEKGVTVSKMCLDLGMSKSVMSELKAGRKRGLMTATLEKMANYLEVPVSRLIGEPIPADYGYAEEIELIRKNPKLSDLLKALAELPEEKLELVSSLISSMK